jgi:hypothetical protein
MYEWEKWTLLKQREIVTETTEMNIFMSVAVYVLYDKTKW